MKNFLKRLFSFLVTSIVFISVVFTCLYFLKIPIGEYLLYTEKPKKSDTLVILSGTLKEMLINAAKFYNKGYAKNIICCGPDEEEYWDWSQNSFVPGSRWRKHYLTKYGVPYSVITEERRTLNVLEEARFIRELLEDRGSNSAIIIGSPFQMRRIKLSFDKVFKGSDIELNFVSIPVSEVKRRAGTWWKNEYLLTIVFKEYIKIVIYYSRCLTPWV